jgi:translation initiation factor 3 subunit M|uniref:Eukaryotic translation initiation factor 3 subunit M n=1 Tax=Panagrolaimus sp. PS1159 TaxID=55785 RepID=A0AC35GSB2_9BILA
MEDQQKVHFFAYAEEQEQISQLHNYLNQKGANLPPLEANADRFSSVKELIKGSKALAKCTDDIEEVLNSILSIVITFPLEEATKLIQTWSEVALSTEFSGTGWQSNAGRIVTVFSTVFHFYDQHPSLKFSIYKVLVELTGRAKLTKFLDISTSTLNSYFSEWKLTVEQQREVLRVLHAALLSDNRPQQAAEVMSRLLQTYTHADASNAEQDALECVRTAIIDPQTFSFDHLLRIQAVKHLEKNHSALFKLLKIFSHGRLNEFKIFVKENPKFISEKLKIEEGLLLKKIKILTLISLAEQNKVLSYEQLQKELELQTEDELENFLINVLKSKAVSGKLNGVRKEFYITAFDQRCFDRKEWKTLRSNLQNLLDNLKMTKKSVEIASDPELLNRSLHYM